MVLLWWCISARKWFKGPKINVEHHMHGREPPAESKIEGVEASVGSESDEPREKKAQAAEEKTEVPEIAA